MLIFFTFIYKNIDLQKNKPTMKKKFILAAIVFCSHFAFGQKIDPKKIEIVRDNYGVPHVYADTNLEAAYGLAWVTCEDSFEGLEKRMAVVFNKSGKLNGGKGLMSELIYQSFEIDKIVEAEFETKTSPQLKAFLEAYCQGVNDFIAKYPQRVSLSEIKKNKITPKIMLKASISGQADFAYIGVDMARLFLQDLRGASLAPQIKTALIKEVSDMQNTGSNAYLLSSERSQEGLTSIIGNPHTVGGVEGPFEVQINTKEGWNIHGAALPGLPVLAFGTTQNLAFTRTSPLDDKVDLYQLTTNEKGTEYLLDGKWLPLKKNNLKLFVKMYGLVIPVHSTLLKNRMYQSAFGPVFKVEDKYYAMRVNLHSLSMIEQLLKQNLAQNFEEFQDAFRPNPQIALNTFYADKENNIARFSTSRIPKRPAGYSWDGIVPADKSELIWSMDENNMISFDEGFKAINPSQGIIFDANSSAFSGYAKEDVIDIHKYDYLGYIPFAYHVHGPREEGIRERVDGEFHGKKLSTQDFLSLKFDTKSQFKNFSTFAFPFDLNLLDTSIPEVKEGVEILKKWDSHFDKDSKQATFAEILIENYYHVDMFNAKKYMGYQNCMTTATDPDITYFQDAMIKAVKFMKKTYGTLEVPFGEFQIMKVGDKVVPLDGNKLGSRNILGLIGKDGKKVYNGGDTYVFIASFDKNGLVKLQTVNGAGQSHDPNNPHSKDQMELFSNHQFKTISFDKQEVLKTASAHYWLGK
ncbi:MAG: hypothetical protein C4K58_00385 [Flavobacteriaceae bacterium]|nr:MAG: hypothetical protein C4K58_00385 [Flavobacteriaceae bacterium]